jgi:hypothetical protein
MFARWLAAFGLNSLQLSILGHVLFVVIAGYLVVEHFHKKHIHFHATEHLSPQTQLDHATQMTRRNDVAGAPTDLKRISTTGLMPIALPASPVAMPDEVRPSAMIGVGSDVFGGNGPGGPGSGASLMTPISSAGGFGLEGHFYDLKQTAPTGNSPPPPTGMTQARYLALLSRYASQGMDDSMIEGYYKSEIALHQTAFEIPKSSESAPAAFHVEKEVQPGLWIVHYRAWVQAPQEGTYRFAGFGEDVLIVSIKGAVVLDAGWTPLLSDPALHTMLPFAFPSYKQRAADGSGDGHLRVGKPFHLNASEAVEMDVLIGACRGGCCFHLLVGRDGNKYDATSDGTPIWPYFQIGDRNPPTFGRNDDPPPFSRRAEPWSLAGDDADR